MNNADINCCKEKVCCYFAIKRCFDVIISFASLIFLLPIFLVISLAICVSSDGPVFFCHKRVGLHEKEFQMIKFRTMVQNAEELKDNFSVDQMDEFQINFKLKNDPRVTRLGIFLRRTSLDELPQLINIIKGEMSIVGPRPIVKEELVKYGEYAKLLLSVPPGLTGLWQVNGRNNTSYEQRVLLDIRYICERNIFLDLKIFFKTFKEVFLRLGAY